MMKRFNPKSRRGSIAVMTKTMTAKNSRNFQVVPTNGPASG